MNPTGFLLYQYDSYSSAASCARGRGPAAGKISLLLRIVRRRWRRCRRCCWPGWRWRWRWPRRRMRRSAMSPRLRITQSVRMPAAAAAAFALLPTFWRGWPRHRGRWRAQVTWQCTHTPQRSAKSKRTTRRQPVSLSLRYSRRELNPPSQFIRLLSCDQQLERKESTGRFELPSRAS
jgi:hypothetical protein